MLALDMISVGPRFSCLNKKNSRRQKLSEFLCNTHFISKLKMILTL